MPLTASSTAPTTVIAASPPIDTSLPPMMAVTRISRLDRSRRSDPNDSARFSMCAGSCSKMFSLALIFSEQVPGVANAELEVRALLVPQGFACRTGLRVYAWRKGQLVQRLRRAAHGQRDEAREVAGEHLRIHVPE